MINPRRNRRRPQKASTRRRTSRITMGGEQLEQRRLLANDVGAGTNPAIATDVNADFRTTAQDALILINHLNSPVQGFLASGIQGEGEGEGNGTGGSFFDVNGDGAATANDVLNIINELNDAEGEGELVRYELNLTDVNNNAITSTQVGSLFKLRTFVQDMRSFPSTPKGVFAGYLDVALQNSNLFQIYYGETQRIELTGAVQGGSYTLTYNGQTTDPIQLNTFSPDPIQAALEALPNIGTGDVQVSYNPREGGNSPNDFIWDVLFTGDLAEQNVNEMIMDDTGILGDGVSGMVFELHPADPTDPGTFLSTFQTGPVYPNGQSALSENGEFSEVGSFDGTSELNPPDAEYLLWEITLRATGQGAITFTPNAPEDSASATLIFGSDDPVPEDMVDFGQPVTISVDQDITCNDDTHTVDEGSGQTTIDVLANDLISTAGTLQIAGFGTPSNGGSITINTNGTPGDPSDDLINYTPAADFAGVETFTYTASDGLGATCISTVSVTVNNLNDPPTAVDDTITGILEDSTDNVLDLTSNDSTDPDVGETLTVISATDPANGTVNVNAGVVTYTPDANFNGTDTFTYTVSDGNTGTDSALVTITVVGQNDPPTAVDDTFTVSEDQATNLSPLDNDTDIDGDTLTILSATTPSNGTTEVVNGTSIRYTPSANFVGADSFTYVISDNNGATSSATVNINVDNVQDPPTAVNDTATVDELSSGNILTVLANDTDVDGDTLTVTAVSSASNGTATVTDGGGSVTYTPNVDFTGADTFTYTISDGTDTDTASVTVNVVPAVRPRARTDAFTIDEDSGLTTLDVLANDLSNDGATPVLLSIVSSPDSGSLNINGNVLEYTPESDFNGAVTFQYSMNDTAGTGADSTATATITINPVNDGPGLTLPTPLTTSEDVALTVANGTSIVVADPDGDVTVEVSLSASNGTLSAPNGAVQVSGDGTSSLVVNGLVSDVNTSLASLTYTPNQDYSGSDVLSVTIDDLGNVGGGSLTDSGAVSLTIDALNDPPVINADTIVGPQNVDLSLSSISITDVDSGVADLDFTFAVDSGVLTFGDVSGLTSVTGNGSANISASGSVSAINSALSTLLFTPVTEFEGDVTLSITADDLGNTGGAGAGTTDSATVTLVITGENNPPVLTTPAAVTVNEDESVALDIDLADPDAGDGILTLSLTSTLGTLNFGTTGSLSVSGNDSSAVTLNGTLADLNAALDSLQFTGPANVFGTSTISVVANDNGNTGEGGALTDTATFDITIESVNDAPTAVDDSASVIASTGATTINLTGNDSIEPDANETLQVIAVNGNAGTATITADGTGIDYTAPEGFEGTDNFTYTVSDGNGGTDTASVSVEVLQFSPSLISGDLFLDVDGDNTMDSTEHALSGLLVTLVGTDFQGNFVSLETHTDANGNYSFGDDEVLAPGSYSITAEHPSNMIPDGTSDTTFVTIPAQGGVTMTDLSFSSLGLTAPFISLSGFLASRHGANSVESTGMMINVSGTDELEWYSLGDGWDGYTVTDVDISNGIADISLLHSSGNRFMLSLEMDSLRLSSRSSGGATVMVVFGGSSDMTLTPIAAGEGEAYEAAVDAIFSE